MGQLLRNAYISLYIDLPLEGYQSSRFDWTGKITKVRYKGISISGQELPQRVDSNDGLGFYNEFGIDCPVGFDEIAEGEWFHKIGVGLLKKVGDAYNFQQPYEIKPANFEINTNSNDIIINCTSDLYNGFSYVLMKKITLLEDGFEISYELRNTGEKSIQTSEYVHNFIAINDAAIDPNYELSFPFDLIPDRFIETVNKEKQVTIEKQGLSFLGQSKEPFFFSNVSGNETVKGKWTLINKKYKIGLSETTSFDTNAINVWGWGHVISPELFLNIDLAPGQSNEWKRVYKVLPISS